MVLCKAYLVLALLGLCVFGGSAHGENGGDSAASKTKVCANTATIEAPRHSGICYVSETKTAKLSAQLSSVVLALKSDCDHHHEHQHENQTTLSDHENPKTICSSSRINQITQDLGSVANQLWSFANRVRNVSDTEFEGLEKETLDLIKRLQEIRVVTGPQLTPDAIISQSFEGQVELLEHIFESTVDLLKDSRPARPPIKFKPRPPASNVPRKPSVSRGPIAAMYAGSLSNFDRTLQFIKGKSSLEDQILGYIALYKEMAQHSHLDTFELTTLAAQVQSAKNRLASAVSGEVESELEQLTADIGPLMSVFKGNSTCRFTNVAISQDLGTTGGWPEYGVVFPPARTENLTVRPWNGGPLIRIYSEYNTPFYVQGSSTFDYSRRYLKMTNSAQTQELMTSGDGFFEWKLVPASGGQHIRILNARYDEAVFVDSSEMHNSGGTPEFRRVFLKRHDYSGSVNMPVNGDLWTINCF